MSLPPLPTLRTRRPKHYPNILPYRTRWLDNDTYAHLNNAIYQHLFDSIINSYYITDCGYVPSEASNRGFIAKSEIVYLGPPVTFPEVVRVGARLIGFGAKGRVIWECAVFGDSSSHDDNDDNSPPRAVGRMVHVFVSKATGKGIGSVPESVRRGVERLVVEGVQGDEGEEVEGREGKAKL